MKLVETRQSVTVAATGTSFTTTYNNDDVKGLVRYAVLKVPTYTNSVNTTLSIVDTYGQTIYTASAVAITTTTVVVLPYSTTSTTSPFPIEPGYVITLTLANVAGTSGGTVYLTMWVEMRG